MSVIDIKSAYRAVPIRGDHRRYLGFRWELEGKDKVFVDNRLSFGLCLGPCYFDEISMFVHDTLLCKYDTKVINYLDDFIVVASTFEECLRGQSHVISLLRFLGFHVSYEKVTPPSRCTVFHGIEIDSVKMELRLPESKLSKLRDLLQIYLGREKISKHDLESLGGLLSHCAHMVRGGKIFCRRLYQLYKDMLSKGRKIIRIPAEVRNDIMWWSKFCSIFNGISKINNEMHQFPMVSDASMTGFGVYWGRDWAAGIWDADKEFLCVLGDHIVKPPIEISERKDVNINVMELWPIVLGLKRWENELRNKSLLLFTDNTQVMYMLKNGKSCNKMCMSWIREFFCLENLFDCYRSV